MPGVKTANFAYNPYAVQAYVESKSKIKIHKVLVTRRGRTFTATYKRRYVNGRLWRHDTSGRALARWIHRGVEPSRAGVVKLLEDYGLNSAKFERWARRNHIQAVLRDRTQEATDGQ
jgi:hypothetical protein